jgi:predicted RNA-binding protein with TRAM domain
MVAVHIEGVSRNHQGDERSRGVTVLIAGATPPIFVGGDEAGVWLNCVAAQHMEEEVREEQPDRCGSICAIDPAGEAERVNLIY